MVRRTLQRLLIASTLLFNTVVGGLAQSKTLEGSKAFGNSETMNYNVVFKWGIVQGKVGEATITNKPMSSSKQYFTQVKFRTTGMGNMVFSTRDTLETLYSGNGLPLRYEKRGKEKSTYLKEEITFTHLPSAVQTKIHSIWGETVMADTTYSVPNQSTYVLDLVSTLALVRSIDPNSVSKDTKFKISIPLGKSVVYGDVQFVRFDRAKHPNGEVVPAICLMLNIRDKAFDTSKNSVEVYLSKDEDLLPLLVRAKLKIGYAECILKDYHSSEE